MAEILLQRAFTQAGLDVIVDSAGVSNEEAGNPMDRRAVRVLERNNLPTKNGHQAKRISAADLAAADLVIPMTASHAKSLRKLAAANGLHPEIRMMRYFDPAVASTADSASSDDYRLDVDDPWYGGPQEFADCLAELQAAVPGVVDFVAKQIGAGTSAARK